MARTLFDIEAIALASGAQHAISGSDLGITFTAEALTAFVSRIRIHDAAQRAIEEAKKIPVAV